MAIGCHRLQFRTHRRKSTRLAIGSRVCNLRLHGLLWCFVALASLLACTSSDDNADSLTSVQGPLGPEPDGSCTGFFGRPNENTGLTDTQCVPQIGMDVLWQPPDWTNDRLATLRAFQLVSSQTIPLTDPYLETAPTHTDGEVCGVTVQSGSRYRIDTTSVDEARRNGAMITHGGGCGLCSSLADLAAYAQTADLTEPVRTCGLQGGLDNDVAAIAECIEDSVGFTPPCARIWAYNTLHTRARCLTPCIELLDAPYLESDGRLNDCLQCDEDESGPVFKSVAGRTRRNSGLATALCRPCETVWRLNHNY